jgi:hypothetical protein
MSNKGSEHFIHSRSSVTSRAFKAKLHQDMNSVSEQRTKYSSKRKMATASVIRWSEFWLQIQRSGFDSRRYQIFREVVSLERGPLSLMSTIEELSGRNTSGFGLEKRD